MLNLLLLAACSPQGPWASAARITSLNETIGGPKGMARVDDYRLENDRVRFNILGPRYSLGPSPFGGTVADADLQRADPRWGGGHGNDQLAEVFGTVNMNLVAADEEPEVELVSEGGDAAILRVDAAGEPFLSLLEPLWTIVDQPEFRITTEYTLEPGMPGLRMKTTASVTTPGGEDPAATLLGANEDLDVLGLALENGVTFGDFYLQGGAIDVFSPGVGFDEDRAVYDRNQEGINTFADPFRFEFVAGVGDGVSYGLVASEGDLYVPLFTSSQTAAFGAGIQGEETDGVWDRFPDGAAYSYERWLVVGKGDVGSVLDAILEVRGEPSGRVTGHVVEEGTGVALSGVSVLVFREDLDGPYSQWLTDVGEDTQADGSFGGNLGPGNYELLVHKAGRPDGERVPITVEEGQDLSIVLSSPRAGQVSIEVVDETGRLVPAKLSFTGEEVQNPAYGDHYLPGEVTEVVFTPDGRADVVLPPGTYTAIATRGLEYELGISEPFTVTDDGVNRLTLQVERSVDTSGFVSADFHVHAINSFDSGTTLTERVVTMVAEGVEFFCSTDHDYLTDYAPVVEDLGLEPWVKTAVGLETTTLEIGHFLGFPLAQKPLEEQGGAFDWTGMTPEDILDTLQEIGEADGYDPVRMVAHPRDGILGLFDQYGFNSYTGAVETPSTSLFNELLLSDAYTDDYEALELLNGKRFEIVRSPTQVELDAIAAGEEVTSYDLVERSADEQEDMLAGTYRLGYGHEGQVDDWFTLLNQGAYITAVGNSDTHGRFEIEAGCPRNYVASATDDPAHLDEQDIATAVRNGQVVASYGPFIRFWANDPENIVGSEIVDTDGTVDLHIEVQAPSWMTVDRVEVYQNGTLIHEYEGLGDDIYRLVQDLPVEVDRDSWFVVIALGDGDLAPLFSPVEIPPVQLQDVVTEALASVPAVGTFLSPGVPITRNGVVVPYALTNPIRVDVDDDGWEAPGQPDWLEEPLEPVE